MKYIVDFFSAIAEVITSLVNLLIDTVTSLVQFFLDLPDYILLIESFIELLPASIKVIAVMTLSAILIFVIIGRRGK